MFGRVALVFVALATQCSLAALADEESLEDGNSICPDPHFMCPGRGTCCMGPTGSWGCCPFPAATCCIDGLHCCPFGTTCSGSVCVHNSNKIMEALERTPAIEVTV